MKKLSLLLLMLFCFNAKAATQSMYPFNNNRQQAQFEHLLKELRCLVCQNQDLSDSNADLAKDLRKQVYDMVLDGQSDSDITNYLTKRYGDFVLFKPPVKAATYVLWFAPMAFLLLGMIIFISYFRKHE